MWYELLISLTSINYSINDFSTNSRVIHILPKNNIIHISPYGIDSAGSNTFHNFRSSSFPLVILSNPIKLHVSFHRIGLYTWIQCKTFCQILFSFWQPKRTCLIDSLWEQKIHWSLFTIPNRISWSFVAWSYLDHTIVLACKPHSDRSKE